jgi:hypothetical protein
MTSTNGLDALRRANPRHKPDFAESAGDLARKAVTRTSVAMTETTDSHGRPSKPALWRWPAIGIPAVATVVAVVVTLIAVGSPVGPLAVAPAEAMQQAVIASAEAAESSGTVELHITQDGDEWVAKTLRWNGTDLSIAGDDPSRVGRGDLLVVDGVMYGPDPEVAGGWIEMGPPESVDPDSGTTPDEYLAAIGEDVGGATMQRITGEMTDLTTSQAEDGSTLYNGRVRAAALARETGVKEGETIRVLPFGNVAHDDANDPASLIDISISVRPDGTIGEILATWGGQSSWSYRLTYSDLGSTAPLEKPTNVQPCPRCWSTGAEPSGPPS